MSSTVREFLSEATLSREEVDQFLDPEFPNWARFDPELGYLLCNSVMQDGIDECVTDSNYQPTGERKTINCSDKPCRINTYGNSFTQCHQVSDGETWQEYLAAHLCEPVRNFGVGGYGVYQAYRRMLRVESSGPSAEYIILNIWDDDHFRSLDKWRWLRIPEFWRMLRSRSQNKGLRTCFFHSNPWAHIRMNLQTGRFIECQNPYPTPESLYKLTDKDHVYDSFRGDIILQLIWAIQYGVACDWGQLEKLAAVLEVKCDFDSEQAVKKTALALHRRYALRASEHIVRSAKEFAQTAGKKLMILLSYSDANIVEACAKRQRFDKEFLRFLEKEGIFFVDLLQKHVEDFEPFDLSPQEYVRRYYIGHYNPTGNHFFAFAIKNAVVDWLDPKPFAYMLEDESIAAAASKLAQREDVDL